MRSWLLVGVAVLWASPLPAVEPLRQIPAVVHAHSTYGNGDQSLDELIIRARGAGAEGRDHS